MSMNSLSGIQKTAYLTAYTHYEKGNMFDLGRPVSNWIIEKVGIPEFSHSLKYLTLVGIPYRAKVFDDWIIEALDTSDDNFSIVSIGCGFDSRWYLLKDYIGTKIKKYIEVDLESTISLKNDILQDSPFSAEYSKIISYSGYIQDNINNVLQECKNTTPIFIFEGVLDYLDENTRKSIMQTVTNKFPNCIILIDAINSFALKKHNKNPIESTGHDSVKFIWAPKKPNEWYGDELYKKLYKSNYPFKYLIGLRSRVLAWLPMPKCIKECYSLLQYR